MPSLQLARRRGPRPTRLAPWLLVASALAGCGGREPHTDPSVFSGGGGGGGGGDALPASCNPLHGPGVCLLPFPSAVFLEEDAGTATGLRLALTSETFPVSRETGVPFDPARLNRADGFSPASEILAYFAEPIDPASLPSFTDFPRSVEASSATLIVDMETGEAVPHFAEVDAYALPENGERQALILRAATRLESGRRYAVAVTDAIRTVSGQVPPSPEGWEAIASGTASEGLAKKQAERMPEIFAALEKAGAPKERLVVAWDFVTSSQASQLADIEAMRETTLSALESAGPEGLGYAITAEADAPSASVLKLVRGTFKVPKFLTNVEATSPETALARDEAGLPVADGTYDAPFTLILPKSAASLGEGEKLRLLVVGHGFLGSGARELGFDPKDPNPNAPLQAFADAHKFALIATDWPGLSQGDRANAAAALVDVGRASWITDRLHQAVVNAVVLARTARDHIAKDPALFVEGGQVIDGSRVDYYGLSLGGILGGVVTALSPDLERSVLHVAGGQWSTLFQRSSNWAGFALFVDSAYPDRVDQQIVIEVLQALIEPADPITYAGALLASDDKRVLLQEALADAQVPNLATEIYARTLGLPLLTPSPKPIFGLEEKAGPLPRALTVWDVGASPEPPPTNKGLPLVNDNKAHDELRKVPAQQAQVNHFFRNGEVISTCEGACDPD